MNKPLCSSLSRYRRPSSERASGNAKTSELDALRLAEASRNFEASTLEHLNRSFA